MAKELYTEIEIDAPAAKVWDILANFDQYGDWNPFIKSISGDMSEGSQLRVTIQPVGGKPMHFRPTAIRIQIHQEFRWLGHLFVPGLFDGEHYFQIEEVSENTVRFVQGEQFRGILVPLLWGSMESGTTAGFKAMNAALKQKAEMRS
jgi:hypothetical protein